MHHFFVLTTFWRHLWSITEKTHGNMESHCLIILAKFRCTLDWNWGLFHVTPSQPTYPTFFPFVLILSFPNALWLAFIAGFQCQIKTVQHIKSKNWEMKGGTYAKTLAKIQVRGIFRIRDIRRNVLSKLIEIFTETPYWSSPGWAPTWRTQINRNSCYRVLLQKLEFILRESHKH